eukprot:1054740-Pleurochrysis_carterae.AAC.1
MATVMHEGKHAGQMADSAAGYVAKRLRVLSERETPSSAKACGFEARGVASPSSRGSARRTAAAQVEQGAVARVHAQLRAERRASAHQGEAAREARRGDGAHRAREMIGIGVAHGASITVSKRAHCAITAMRQRCQAASKAIKKAAKQTQTNTRLIAEAGVGKTEQQLRAASDCAGSRARARQTRRLEGSRGAARQGSHGRAQLSYRSSS